MKNKDQAMMRTYTEKAQTCRRRDHGGWWTTRKTCISVDGKNPGEDVDLTEDLGAPNGS